MSSLHEKEQAEIEDLAAQGLGQRRIAAELGLTYGQVRYYMEQKRKAQYDNPKLAKTVGMVDRASLDLDPFRAYVWDLETTDLKADIGELRVAAFLDLNTGAVEARTIDYFDGSHTARERALAIWARGKYEEADVLIGHNTLAFDRHFLQTVLVRHGEAPLADQWHIDTYQVARYGLKWSGGKSLANLADVLELELGKDKPSKNDWRRAIGREPDAVKRLMVRCVEDVRLNALVWQHPAMKAGFRRWKGQR